MKNLISLIIYGILFIIVITLFINLLPFLILALIIFLIIRYFKEKKEIDQTNTYYESNFDDLNTYQHNGSIKNDVIDVEYKETVEK